MNGPASVTQRRPRLRLLLLLFVVAAELWLVLAISIFARWRDIAASWAEFVHRATRQFAPWPGHVLVALGSIADLFVVPLTFGIFWYAVPASAPETDSAQRRGKHRLLQRFGQFRLLTLLGLVTLCAIVFGVCRGTRLHPALVLAGMLYCCGPWAAILVGVLVRAFKPQLEHQATCVTLLVVLLIATGFALVSTLASRPYAIGLRDLWRLTAILWPPQVILCFAMRRLLLPLDEAGPQSAVGTPR